MLLKKLFSISALGGGHAAAAGVQASVSALVVLSCTALVVLSDLSLLEAAGTSWMSLFGAWYSTWHLSRPLGDNCTQVPGPQGSRYEPWGSLDPSQLVNL